MPKDLDLKHHRRESLKIRNIRLLQKDILTVNMFSKEAVHVTWFTLNGSVNRVTKIYMIYVNNLKKESSNGNSELAYARKEQKYLVLQLVRKRKHVKICTFHTRTSSGLETQTAFMARLCCPFFPWHWTQSQSCLDSSEYFTKQKPYFPSSLASLSHISLIRLLYYCLQTNFFQWSLSFSLSLSSNLCRRKHMAL